MREMEVQHGLHVGKSPPPQGGVGSGGYARGSEPGKGSLKHSEQHSVITLFLLPMCLNQSELLELSRYATVPCFCDFVILQTAEWRSFTWTPWCNSPSLVSSLI